MHYMADPVHLQPAQISCERQYTTADTDIRCWFLERYMAERQDESTAAREVSRRNLLEDMLQYRGIELRRFIWDLALPWAKVDQQRCFEQRFQEPLLWEQDMPQHHGPSPEGIRAILRAVWRRVAADFLDALPEPERDTRQRCFLFAVLQGPDRAHYEALRMLPSRMRRTWVQECQRRGLNGCGSEGLPQDGARGALSLQRSTTSILLNGPDHASYYRCTWTSVSANKLDQAARSAPLMFHVRWRHVCLHFIYRRVVVRMHTGLSVQVSRLSVLGWICGSVHRTGRRALVSASLCAAPHVLCQHPGTGHASVSALVKLTCLRAIVRIMADALRPERLRALQTASFLLGDHRLLTARSAAPYTHTELKAILPSLLFSVPPAPATRPCACCCMSCSCQRPLRTGTALKTHRGKPATLENPGSPMQMVDKARRGCALQAQILLRPISCIMSARLYASVPAGHEDVTQQLCGSASCMQACLLTHGAHAYLLSHRLCWGPLAHVPGSANATCRGKCIPSLQVGGGCAQSFWSPCRPC